MARFALKKKRVAKATVTLDENFQAFVDYIKKAPARALGDITITKDPLEYFSKLEKLGNAFNPAGWMGSRACNGSVSMAGYNHLFACAAVDEKTTVEYKEWSEFLRKCGFSKPKTIVVGKNTYLYYEDKHDISRKAKWQLLRYMLPNENGFEAIKERALGLYKTTDLPALKCLQLAHFIGAARIQSGSRGVWGKNGGLYYFPKFSKRSETEPILLKPQSTINQTLGFGVHYSIGETIVNILNNDTLPPRDAYRFLFEIGKSLGTRFHIVDTKLNSKYKGNIVVGTPVTLKCITTHAKFKKDKEYELNLRFRRTGQFCECKSPCNEGIRCNAAGSVTEKVVGLFHNGDSITPKNFRYGELFTRS